MALEPMKKRRISMLLSSKQEGDVDARIIQELDGARVSASIREFYEDHEELERASAELKRAERDLLSLYSIFEGVAGAMFAAGVITKGSATVDELKRIELAVAEIREKWGLAT